MKTVKKPVYSVTCRSSTGLPEIWRTDGIPQGTQLIKDILPGPENSFVRDFFSLDTLLYFTANDGMITR